MEPEVRLPMDYFEVEPVQTTTFALHDFCQYPHWVQELRLELDQASQESTLVDPESLVLLDGFVQESMRMNTSDASKVNGSQSSTRLLLTTSSQRATESHYAFSILRWVAGASGRLGVPAATSNDARRTVLPATRVV